MDVTIGRSAVAGTAEAPPSKSYTHRAVLAAGYGDGAHLKTPLVSADTRATMRAVDAFGGEYDVVESGVRVEGFGGRPGVPPDVIDCSNSGTTMRLVTAAAALADGTTVLTGDQSLRSRPQGPLLEAIEQLGGQARSTRRDGRAPLVVNGPISGGDVLIPGDVSSQFVTALLMAGAITDEGVDIELETPLKSAPYVDITREVLDEFGVKTVAHGSEFSVTGGQYYEPKGGEYSVPGDFSSISYLVAAGVLTSEDGLRIRRADPGAQGDTVIVDIVDRMGGDIDWNQSSGVLTVSKSRLEGTTVDVGDTPDLLPTIAVLGAAAEGTTRITNCAHVRYKETDRVAVMAEVLEQMGVSASQETDSLTIDGTADGLTGTTVDGRSDHRIIMAVAVAGLVADGETTIHGAEHVDVSFPGFFDLLHDLGASVER